MSEEFHRKTQPYSEIRARGRWSKRRAHRMAAPTDSSQGFSWPDGARIAVVVTCLMENWSGDKGPPFSVQTTSLKPGTHDRAAMTWGGYGSRPGVWPLKKILNEHEAPSTFVANAHSMELPPDAVECMLK